MWFRWVADFGLLELRLLLLVILHPKVSPGLHGISDIWPKFQFHADLSTHRGIVLLRRSTMNEPKMLSPGDQRTRRNIMKMGAIVTSAIVANLAMTRTA